MKAAILPGMVAALAFVLWQFIRWIRATPLTPDPWEGEWGFSEAEPGEDAFLCSRCLAPQSASAYFCEHCGLALAPFATWSPYLYTFSLGDLLRVGTAGTFRISALVVGGFVLTSSVLFAPLAPLYWWRLVQNIRRLRR